MSEESLQAFARQIVDTFNLGQEAYMALHTADAVQVTAPEWPEGGTYNGVEAVRDVWTPIFAGQEMRAELEDVVVIDDNRVLSTVRVHSRGFASGATTTTVLYTVTTEREGLISRIEHHLDHAQALEAAGLSE